MYNVDSIKMADTIKLMMSDNTEDVILADYLQSLIKLDALENKLDLMSVEDEMYPLITEEINTLIKYKTAVLKKLWFLQVDIESKINELKNSYDDLYRY